MGKDESSPTSDHELTAREIFDYVDGRLPTDRADEIRRARLQDEELAAKIKFMRVIAPPDEEQDD